MKVLERSGNLPCRCKCAAQVDVAWLCNSMMRPQQPTPLQRRKQHERQRRGWVKAGNGEGMGIEVINKCMHGGQWGPEGAESAAIDSYEGHG